MTIPKKGRIAFGMVDLVPHPGTEIRCASCGYPIDPKMAPMILVWKGATYCRLPCVEKGVPAVHA